MQKCAFCNPKKKDWEEDGFYGFQCTACTDGGSAFIVLSDHRKTISEEERETMNKLIEKHYPHLKPKGLSVSRNQVHFYEFLVRK